LDDTRDIAIKAGEAAASAHHRLDKMNGSIDRLGDETEHMRLDATAGFSKLTEDLAHGMIRVMEAAGETNVEVARIRTTVSNALKVVAALVALLTAITAGVTVYAVTHLHAPRPQVTTPAAHTR
jgi:hypothetical protein